MTAMRFLSCLAIVLTVTSACGGSGGSANTAHLRTDEDAVRYRLPLRDNPIDRREAALCYAECQGERDPSDYLGCLAECPGFEVTPGEVCSRNDVPPVAACLVVRKVTKREQTNDGLIVLGVVGTFALVVTAASLCASSASHCGYYETPPR